MLTLEEEQRLKRIEDIINLLVGGDRYTIQRNMQIFDMRNIQVGKTVGTKIGTEGGATGQKLGFFDATPVLQQLATSHNSWAKLSDIISALVNLGLLDAVGTPEEYLALNNTVAFTPDANYEPATKKYVDDNAFSGFSSRIRAYSVAGSQSIDANAATKVTLGTENYDGLGEFATSRFTATVAGYYAVTGEVTIDNLDVGEIAQALIYVNNAEYSRNAAHSALANTIVRVTISDIVYLGVGGYVELYAYQNSAEGAKSISAGSTVTFLAIHRLS